MVLHGNMTELEWNWRRKIRVARRIVRDANKRVTGRVGGNAHDRRKSLRSPRRSEWLKLREPKPNRD